MDREPTVGALSDAIGLDALIRATGLKAISVEALAGDVGRRRYFRIALADGCSVVGVVYPPDEEHSRRRWTAAQALLGNCARVPALIADDARGNQIVEDLGTEDLAARFTAAPAERRVWLGRAADAAAAIAGLPDPGINPAFDAALLGRELDLAREAVFEMFLGSSLTAAELAAHDAWRDSLVREILEHPFALCHRDFHGNNLFPLGESVALIDFQDLRLGPDSYDVASLLWERTTLDWMDDAQAGEVVARFTAARGLDATAFATRMRRVLLQRAWKACGTFARAVALGKGSAYRRYLPDELRLVHRLLSDSAEDSRFRTILEGRSASVC